MRVSKQLLRRLAPFAYLIALAALLASGTWALVNRRFDIYLQVGLGVAVVGLAAGILLDPDRVRAALRGRQARFGSNSLLLSVAFAGIVIVANYLAVQNPERLDLTEDQTYSLAPESIRALEQLDQEVLIMGFFTPDAQNSKDAIRPLLDEYKFNSQGKLSYEFVDPLQDPIPADQYGVTRDRSLVVIASGSSEVVSVSTEQQITSAIIRVTNPGVRKLAFLTGHGERDSDAVDDPGYRSLKRALEAKSYDPHTLNLLAEGRIPEETLAVIIAGPNVGVTEEEVALLGEFQSSGGALVVLLDPSPLTDVRPDSDRLLSYLQDEWDVLVRDDMIVDLNSILPLVGISFQYGDHPITARLGNLATLFPTARSLQLAAQEDSVVTQAALVSTSENSWGETDLEGLASQESLEFTEEEDVPGPMVMAAAIENQDSGARLVVFGDSDFTANADFFQGGNGDLMVNSVDWATGEENLIDITPKQNTPRFVTPPSVQTLGLIFLLTMILIPGGAVALGLSVWWRRRRQP